MICPNCKFENKGIKLNGKLFCISCGEIMENAIEILEHSYEIQDSELKNNPIEPRRFSKEGKDITPHSQNENINLLEAEEEVIEEIEKVLIKSSQIRKKQEIIKKNRERITIKPSSGFNLILNEPDPIKEPELPSPHNMQITSHKEIDYEKKISFPLHERKEQQSLQQNIEMEKNALTIFSKEGVSGVQIKKQKKKSKKKLFVLIFIPFVFFVAIVSVIIITHVNSSNNNPEEIIKKIETKPSFDYNPPSYISPGYEITNQSYSYSTEIHYIYEYLPDTNKQLIINISKVKNIKTSILEDIIKPLHETYYKYPMTEFDVWFVGDKKALFVYNDLLYEISTSDKMITSEVIKIIKGLI